MQLKDDHFRIWNYLHTKYRYKNKKMRGASLIKVMPLNYLTGMPPNIYGLDAKLCKGIASMQNFKNLYIPLLLREVENLLRFQF